MKKKKGVLPQIKKDIKTFLSSEEGKINKKDIAKLGMALTVPMLPMALTVPMLPTRLISFINLFPTAK